MLSLFLARHQHQHRTIFGCAFSFPPSVPPLWAYTSFVWRNKRQGEAGSHYSAPGCLLYLSVSCLCSISLLFQLLFSVCWFSFLLSPSLCFSPSFPHIPPLRSLYWVGHLHTVYPRRYCVFAQPPVCVEREGQRERGDLVEEGMSLHAVIGYYFSSSALLFYLSFTLLAPQQATTTEPLFSSPSSMFSMPGLAIQSTLFVDLCKAFRAFIGLEHLKFRECLVYCCWTQVSWCSDGESLLLDC